MNPEQSRRVDAALDQRRSLQRPNPHHPVLLDTLAKGESASRMSAEGSGRRTP